MYFKELAHTIVGAGKSEICRASQQPGCLSRVSMWHPGGRNFFLMGTQFFLLRPSDNWIRPKHTIQATGSDGQETICNAGDPGSIPASGRSPGEGDGNPLQYYCLENTLDR